MSRSDFLFARVIDDGPGVSPEVLPRLFEAFGPTAGRMGNGLGLHVSREAARAQGGDLVLESTGPDGCVFTLSDPEGHPVRILLADDDADIREVATHLLGRRGWDVATVTNGDEAADALARRAVRPRRARPEHATREWPRGRRRAPAGR